jgi:ribose transport system permease protein
MSTSRGSSEGEAPAVPESGGAVAMLGHLRTGLRRIVSFEEFGVALWLIAMVVIIGIRDSRFLELNSLIDLIRQSSFVGIMAFGMVFLLAMREIDLSVGAIYGLSVVGAGLAMREGIDPWFAMLFGLFLGVVAGAVNGVLSNTLRVATIVITLGMLSAIRGLILVWSNARPIIVVSSSTTAGAGVTGASRDHLFFKILGGKFLGIPFSAWVLVIVAIVLTVVLKRTRFGVMVRSIGANERAAEFAGIPIKRIRLYALMLMGGLCGLAGMLTLAFFQSADPTLGTGTELRVIAAAIIGGTSLAGGAGTVIGALIGALIIQVISSGLVRFEVPVNWSSFVTGAVIILAVALDGFVRRRRQAQRARELGGTVEDEAGADLAAGAE